MTIDFREVTPNFLGIEPEFSRLETARVVVLPIPFEETTTFLRGTEKGPEAIIAASHHLELYDEEADWEPYRIGMATVEPIKLPKGNLQGMVAQVYQHAKALLDREKFVVSLGGEHSISIGLVQAHREKYPNLTVLQLDAHADLRDSYKGSPYNHACVMARVREMVPYVGVGIRAVSAEEAQLIEEQKLPLFYAYALVESTGWVDRVIERLGDDVYITVDLDCFDPALIPAVGTPDPGGPSWYSVLELLRRVAEEKDVVGFDVVELRPIPNNPASDFAAAKLTYKLLSYVFSKEQPVEEETPGEEEMPEEGEPQAKPEGEEPQPDEI